MSEIDVLADRLFDAILDRFPVDASLMGFDVDHESLVDHSEEADRRHRERLRELGEAAERLELETLPDRITQGIVLHEVRMQSDDLDSRQVEFGISANLRTTVACTLAFLPRLPVNTPERRAGYLERLRRLDGFLTTMIDRHRKGFANGRTPVKHLVEQSIELMDGHLANLGAFDIVEDASEIIEQVVRPAIENYRDFLRDEALPLGRDAEHAGLCWLPEGDALYRMAVHTHTTEDLDPEDLHATGIRLIEDLKQEFAQYGDDVFDRIRNDPALRHRSAEEMLDGARRAVAKAEAAAPQWFRTLPDRKCVIEEAPAAVPAHVPPHYFPRGGGRQPARHVLRQHQGTAEPPQNRGRGHGVPRGRAGSSLRALQAGPAQGPPHRAAQGTHQRVRRRLGPVLRTPR